MIIKAIKSVILLSFVGVASYYISHTDNKTLEKTQQNAGNEAKKIEYRFSIDGGQITISSESVDIKNTNEIKLTNVYGHYKTNLKDVIIKSKRCTFFPFKKKAILEGQVEVVSDKMQIQTTNAIVDADLRTVSSESKVVGQKGAISFEGEGFLVDSSGKISLKHARIMK